MFVTTEVSLIDPTRKQKSKNSFCSRKAAKVAKKNKALEC